MNFIQYLFLLHEELRKSVYFTDVLFTSGCEKKCFVFKFYLNNVHLQQLNERSSKKFTRLCRKVY